MRKNSSFVQVFMVFWVSFLFGLSVSKFRWAQRKFECDPSGKTLLTNVTCTYKTFKRESYLTFKGTIIRKFPYAKMNYVSRRMNSDGYQTVVEIKDIPICEILNNLESEGMFPFIRDSVKHAKQQFKNGNLLDGCNIVGDINLFNGSFTNFTSLEVFPPGDYFNTWYFHDGRDPKIINISFIGRLFKFK